MARCSATRPGNITKFAIVDRFSATAEVAKMFWLGCGPATPDTARRLHGGA